MIGPNAVAFRYKISVKRQEELQASGVFPEPDFLRPVGKSGNVTVPMWLPRTVEEFLTNYPKEDNRRDYHNCGE